MPSTPDRVPAPARPLRLQLAARWSGVRRRVLLHRRLLVALCAGGAVLLAVQAASPPAPPTATVWVATRALPGGAELAADAVEAVAVPPDLVPDDAVTDPDDVVGRPLAAPVSRGEALTRQRVVGPGLSAAYPGTAAVPVRFADAAVVDLVRPGDRVDVVAAPDDGSSPPALLVADVAVAAVPDPVESASQVGSPGRLVVLAVPRSEAAAVAAATTTAVLIPVWSQ